MKLIFVMLCFLGNLYAQEIGILYVEDKLPKTPFGSNYHFSTLSPNGKSFYTLLDGVITKWSLDPIKKLDAFKVRDACAIWVGVDGKLIILVENKLLQLDPNTKEILKMVKEDVYHATMINSSLVTIDKTGIIKKWDSVKLKELISLQIPSYDCGDECIHDIFTLIYDAISKTLAVLTFDGRVILINAETFVVIKTLYSTPDDRYYISPDNRNIYRGRSEVEKIDLRSGNAMLVSKEWFKQNRFRFIRYDISRNRPQYSAVGELAVIGNRRNTEFYNYHSRAKLLTLHQPNNQEWIAMTPDGYFDISENARKFIYMKKKSGEFEPIDDEAYKKYNKKINLKAK